MFGISFYEIFIIVVVILIFLKPKDMVSTAINIYKFFGEIKNYFYKFKNDIEQIDVLNNFDNYIVENKTNPVNQNIKTDTKKRTKKQKNNN